MDIKYPPLEAVFFIVEVYSVSEKQVSHAAPRLTVKVSALQDQPTFYAVFAADFPYCSVDFAIQSRRDLLLFICLAVEGVRYADSLAEPVTLKARTSRHPVRLRGGGGGCASSNSVGSLSEESDLFCSDGIAAQPCFNVLLFRMPSPPAMSVLWIVRRIVRNCCVTVFSPPVPLFFASVFSS